jgi:hypothetical protein
MVPGWLVQVLHPPQKFERPPFCNGWRYGIKKYGIEVIFNGMTSLLNYITIYQLVQKLLGWDTQTDRRTDRQTYRQTGDLTSLTFLFKESRLTKIFLGIRRAWTLESSPCQIGNYCDSSGMHLHAVILHSAVYFEVLGKQPEIKPDRM